jgi:hypothetical protein
VSLAACSPTFTPPEHPEHEGGDNHAEPRKTPFLCASGRTVSGDRRDDDERGVPCPTDGVRPPDDQLSCDARYCHGEYEYRPDPGRTRHLFGADGPSCYTCHGEEWDED